jgi:hypothetical protein
MLHECTYMHKYIVHVHVWLFLRIVQFNSLIMSYVHQLGIWSSDYWLIRYSRRRKLNVIIERRLIDKVKVGHPEENEVTLC